MPTPFFETQYPPVVAGETMIKARNIDPASALRYVDITEDITPTTAAVVNALPLGVWMSPARYPFPGFAVTSAASAQNSVGWGKIVDVIVFQSYVGVGGTSYSINILKNGTTIFATQPVIALASGAAAVDAAGFLAVPTGATRPVLTATSANLLLKKGDILSYTVGVTGTYTTAANLGVSVIVDPNPV